MGCTTLNITNSTELHTSKLLNGKFMLYIFYHTHTYTLKGEKNQEDSLRKLTNSRENLEILRKKERFRDRIRIVMAFGQRRQE